MFSKSRLLAKFYIYRCKLDNTKPSLIFKAKLKATLIITIKRSTSLLSVELCSIEKLQC